MNLRKFRFFSSHNKYYAIPEFPERFLLKIFKGYESKKFGLLYHLFMLDQMK